MVRGFALVAAALGLTLSAAAGPADAAPGRLIWWYTDGSGGLVSDPPPGCIGITGEGETGDAAFNLTSGVVLVYPYTADCEGPYVPVDSGGQFHGPVGSILVLN